jgi:tape measure domain-containing protein
MASYRLEILVDGQDRGASGVLDRIRGGLGRLATVAGGILAADVFRKIGAGIRDLIGGGVEAAASMQNLTLSLETLIAKEISRGEEATVSRQTVIHLTEAERQKLQDLELQYGTLGARMNEQKERIRQMSEEWTDQGLNVQTAKARLAEMENQYAKIGGQMDELRAKEGKLVTVQDTIRVNTMAMGDALTGAGPKAEELKNKLRDLSLISPFEFEMLANVMRANLAFGATTENVIPLTKAITDMGAGLGLTGEQFDRMSYNLAQALLAGDLTMQNLRQLRMVGLDLAEVFESELGMSIKEVDAALKSGKLTMEDVSASFMNYVENNFGGAAERLSKTWGGLQSSFADLKFFAGIDILGPGLEVLTEALGGLFDKGRELLEDGTFKKIGEEFGKLTSALLSGDVPGTVDALVKALGGLGLPQGAQDVISALTPFFQALKEAWEGDWSDALLNFSAGVGDLGEALGLWDAETGNEIALLVLNLGRGLAALASGDITTATNNLATVGELLGGFLGGDAGQVQELARLSGEIATNLGLLSTNAGLAAETLPTLGGAFETNWTKAGLFGWVLGEVNRFLEDVNDGMAETARFLADLAWIFAGFEEGGIKEVFARIKAAWEREQLATEVDTDRFTVAMEDKLKGFTREGGLLTEVGPLFKLMGDEWRDAQGDIVEDNDTTAEDIEAAWQGLRDALVGHSIIPDMIDDIIDEFGRLTTEAPGAIDFAAFHKAGRSIVGGIKQGIADAWDGFIAWIISQMGTILTAIAEFFNIGSPAKKLIPYGAALPAGLQVGWRASFAEFERAVAGDMTGMMGAFGGGFGFGARPAFAGATAPAAAGGDAINQTFYVQDRLAAAMLAGSLRAGQQARLNSRI